MAVLVTNPPGELLGTGRTADVYGVGLRRVLRRYRDGRDASKEAEAMRYLFKKGYPVPEVFDVAGADIVMAHLSGATMLKTMARKPLQIPEMAKTLARLQTRLNALAPPPFLEVKFGEPSGIIHLDLHPDNIMMTNSGPVVIDFANIAAGPASADAASCTLLAVISFCATKAPNPGMKYGSETFTPWARSTTTCPISWTAISATNPTASLRRRCKPCP